jgi:hypothetical protein
MRSAELADKSGNCRRRSHSMNMRPYGFPGRKPNRKKAFFSWGRCPQTPGIYRIFRQNGCSLLGRLAPPRHSGRWVGARVASLRSLILRPGKVSVNRVGRRRKIQLNNSCRKCHR